MPCSLPAQSCKVNRSPHTPRVEGVLKYTRGSIIALVLQMQHKEIKYLPSASTGGVKIRTQKDRFLIRMLNYFFALERSQLISVLQ